eukprot:2544378-Amphidinium_carterae.1
MEAKFLHSQKSVPTSAENHFCKSHSCCAKKCIMWLSLAPHHALCSGYAALNGVSVKTCISCGAVYEPPINRMQSCVEEFSAGARVIIFEVLTQGGRNVIENGLGQNYRTTSASVNNW